jgi:ATP-dependent Clp protease protease subunit
MDGFKTELTLDNVLVGVPESAANMQLPDPNLRDFYRDEQDRIFWVDSSIDASLLDLVKMIIRCNREDKGKAVEDRVPIKVFIDSPGGEVCALWTTMKAIKISKTPVYTINYCTAFSAAADLLAAGHKRYALPGTSVMVHSGSCMYGGTVEQAENMKKHFDKLGKKITDEFLANTKVDMKKFKKKAISDWYFDEDEALENGIIDEIITNLDILY